MTRKYGTTWVKRFSKLCEHVYNLTQPFKETKHSPILLYVKMAANIECNNKSSITQNSDSAPVIWSPFTNWALLVRQMLFLIFPISSKFTINNLSLEKVKCLFQAKFNK